MYHDGCADLHCDWSDDGHFLYLHRDGDKCFRNKFPVTCVEWSRPGHCARGAHWRQCNGWQSAGDGYLGRAIKQWWISYYWLHRDIVARRFHLHDNWCNYVHRDWSG